MSERPLLDRVSSPESLRRLPRESVEPLTTLMDAGEYKTLVRKSR